MGTFSDNYSCPSNETIFFQLIRNENDITSDSNAFHPLMSHQLFGDDELINGYKDLKITLNFLSCSLKSNLQINYSDKKENADDIQGILSEWVPLDFVNNAESLKELLSKEHSVKPIGDQIDKFVVSSNKDSPNIEEFNKNQRHFVVHHTNLCEEKANNFHERLQSFTVFFIDAANKLTDKNEEKWHCFMLYEITKDSHGHDLYNVIGYAILYMFFHFPSKNRPRISQFLIFPPYQQQGFGKKLLESIYHFYQTTTAFSISEVTTEDPCEEFTILRDIVELKMALNILKYDDVKNGYKLRFGQLLREKLKIAEKRGRRLYELVKLYYIVKLGLGGPNALDEFKKEVKQRFLTVNRKNEEIYKKACSRGQKIDGQKTVIISPLKILNPDLVYNELEEDYLKIINRNKTENVSEQ